MFQAHFHLHPNHTALTLQSHEQREGGGAQGERLGSHVHAYPR
jgi:hypothetical protein